MYVSVILVNFNTNDLTRQCLASVYEKTRGVDFDVYVVDNASTDGSQEAIREAFPEAKLICNPKNLGFAAANNLAIKDSRAKYVFLLNTDTVLVNNAIPIFLEFMEKEENKNVGCCGGSLYDETMDLIMSHGNFPSLKQVFFEVFSLRKVFKSYYRKKLKTSCDDLYETPQKVGYVSGADMFLRKEAMERAGFFDEDFFLYYEDTELCFRLLANGYYSYIVPEAKIIHLFGKSSLEIEDSEKVMLRERSRYKFFRKCYGPITVFFVKTLYILKNVERFFLRYKPDYIKMIKTIVKA